MCLLLSTQFKNDLSLVTCSTGHTACSQSQMCEERLFVYWRHLQKIPFFVPINFSFPSIPVLAASAACQIQSSDIDTI